MASNHSKPASNFIPELWSTEILESYKKASAFNWAAPTKRSKGAQLLRDAALGKPEYPEYLTATEVRMRHEHFTDHAASALARNIDQSIIRSIRDKAEAYAGRPRK